ncbi:MAG: hypothetical protein EHM45_23040 [Desulfobacteraceae bacterium]|nr:MAG: hypothetical protein EHM45_23040 [Desulfobacteraceae bacterium]
MECHRDFPWSKVVYNWACFTGIQVSAVFIVIHLGFFVFLAYLLVTAAAYLLTATTICNRCSYYGRRCALGLGLAASLLRRKGAEAEYCGTKPQGLAILLLAFSIAVQIYGSVRLTLQGAWFWPAVFGLFLLGLALPHPKLMCRYCGQRINEKGACPIGQRLVRP